MAEREVSAVKEWEKELYIYRLSPAPPKKDVFQEYIDLYFSENDEKYLMWFLHYYEPVLNDTVSDLLDVKDAPNAHQQQYPLPQSPP